MRFAALIACVFVMAATSVLVIGQSPVPPAADERPATRPADQPTIDDMVKGEKVLAWFQDYEYAKNIHVVVNPGDAALHRGGKPTPADVATAYAAKRAEIATTIEKAGAKVLRAWEQPITWAYSEMVLLDIKGDQAKTILANMPHFVAGVVFVDGAYNRALPATQPVICMPGKTPAEYGFILWGSGDKEWHKKDLDLARLNALKGVQVTFVPPPPMSAGSSGYVELTPEPGHTLLEVFLRTEAGFLLVVPQPAAQP